MIHLFSLPRSAGSVSGREGVNDSLNGCQSRAVTEPQRDSRLRRQRGSALPPPLNNPSVPFGDSSLYTREPTTPNFLQKNIRRFLGGLYIHIFEYVNYFFVSSSFSPLVRSIEIIFKKFDSFSFASYSFRSFMNCASFVLFVVL